MFAKLTRQSIFPVLMIAAGVILVLGSLLWFVKATRVSVSRSSAASYQASSPNLSHPEIRRVSLADAKAAYDLGTAVFLDVRGDTRFSQDHIPGALSIAENELESRLDELDPSTWIITYCT